MFKQPTHVRGALLTGFVCVVWFFLALRRPELHYHFAPLIAAVLWPLSLRSKGQATSKDASTGALGGIALVLVATLIILLLGNLMGPNFLEQGPAWPEAVLFAVVAGFWGGRVASREKPGLLGSIVDASS